MGLMGGSSKACGHSNSSGNRGRAYGTLILLAFGAAVFGVMLLHKLREKRVFDLLLKDKDRDLLSLQFLLQKERVTTKEVKRKMEEMKAKVYSLRIQKTQLHNKIEEMQSMTASLKQEHRALESALEEKQNENKILRERDLSSAKENPDQIIALTELLKQKEAEIKEMKQSLEKPTKIWSVSADDPSNPPVNLTTTGATAGEERNEVVKSKEENVTAEYQQLQEPMNVKDGQNSTDRHEAESGTEIGDGKQREIPRDEQLKMGNNNPVGENTTQRGDNGGNTLDEHQGEGQIEGDGESVKPEISQEDRDSRGRNQSNINGVVDENPHDGELLKTGDAEVIDEGHGAIKDGELQKPKNPQDGDHGQELSMISKSEMKLQVHPDHVSQIGVISRARGRSRSKRGHRKRRMISRGRELENRRNSKEAFRDMELEKVDSQGAHRTDFSMRDEHDQEKDGMRDGQEDGHSEMHDKFKNEVMEMIDRGKEKDANRNEEAENMEDDHPGKQTGITTETEDDLTHTLDPQIEDIEEHGLESNTEEEEGF